MRRLDLQIQWNLWFSLGVHIDHTGPYIALHLPSTLIAFGWIHYPGFVGWSLRNWGPTEWVEHVEVIDHA